MKYLLVAIFLGLGACGGDDLDDKSEELCNAEATCEGGDAAACIAGGAPIIDAARANGCADELEDYLDCVKANAQCVSGMYQENSEACTFPTCE